MQTTFDFPQPLAEKYRPQKIQDFVGLEKAKRILAKLAANPYESAWLFVGPSGTGKTTMALALAAEVPAELHHIPARECTLEAIQNVCKTCCYMPRMENDWKACKMHLVLIDEADSMTPAAQLAMLSRLDATAFPARTIFILTCNATDNLEKRFLSRCRVIEFSNYGLSGEITGLLASIWDRETDSSAERPNFARIAKESCNNVRDALMTLEVELLAV
jgi:DNA polymerase III gamma/tau subunit